VILTGKGKAFSAGGDVVYMDTLGKHTEKEILSLASLLNSIILELYSFPKPTIAAINGPAMGAGFSIALMCDYRIMSEDAFVMYGYSAIGLTPDGGLSWTLPRIVGITRALDMMIENPRIGAGEALKLDIVHKVIPRKDLERVSYETARGISSKAIGAIARARQLFFKGFSRTLPAQLESERRSIARAACGTEGQVGIHAFVEKENPVYDEE